MIIIAVGNSLINAQPKSKPTMNEYQFFHLSGLSFRKKIKKKAPKSRDEEN
jgi:hypothetical protein